MPSCSRLFSQDSGTEGGPHPCLPPCPVPPHPPFLSRGTLPAWARPPFRGARLRQAQQTVGARPREKAGPEEASGALPPQPVSCPPLVHPGLSRYHLPCGHLLTLEDKTASRPAAGLHFCCGHFRNAAKGLKQSIRKAEAAGGGGPGLHTGELSISGTSVVSPGRPARSSFPRVKGLRGSFGAFGFLSLHIRSCPCGGA